MDVMLHSHKAKDICRVPDGLRELCADISREVIRCQPDDIFCFIFKYLNTLLITRENAKAAVDLVQDVMVKSEQIVDILSGTGLSMKHIAAAAPRLQGAFRSYLESFERRLACGCVEPDKPSLRDCGCVDEDIEVEKQDCGCDVEEPPKKPCGCDATESDFSSDVCSVQKETNYCIKTSCLDEEKKDCGCADECSEEKLVGCEDPELACKKKDDLGKQECGCDVKYPDKSCTCEDNSKLECDLATGINCNVVPEQGSTCWCDAKINCSHE